MRATMKNGKIISDENDVVEGEGVKIAVGRVGLGEGLGEAFGVSKGNSKVASVMLTGKRSGYLSTALTK